MRGSEAPRGRILRVPSPPKLTGIGVRPSSGAAASASRGLAGYSSVLGGAEPAAIEDAAHHTPLGAHLRRRRFPLLLWRRGAGRGGRRSQLARNILVQQPAGMSPRPTESRRVMGLLSPTLSSKGGEGEPRARCLHPMRARCSKDGRNPHGDNLPFMLTRLKLLRGSRCQKQSLPFETESNNKGAG